MLSDVYKVELLELLANQMSEYLRDGLEGQSMVFSLMCWKNIMERVERRGSRRYGREE